METVRPPVRSVSELNQMIKDTLEYSPELVSFQVRGEVSQVSFQKNGYVYFDLKDAYSSVHCAIWRDIPNKKELEAGQEITVLGNISVYTVRGTYTVNVHAFEIAGEGDLAIACAKMKKKLEAEGLFDAAHKKPIPAFPSAVGIVTASTGAAIHDMVKIITQRNSVVDIYVFPVSVQGPNAPREIAAAVDKINEEYSFLDVAIVGRGGGSAEDLAAFNEEIIARAIYRSEVPIISAVGHESDISISDFVADVRAATPTDAANIAVPDTHMLGEELTKKKRRLKEALEAKALRGEQRLTACSLPLLGRVLGGRIEKESLRLEGLKERLEGKNPLGILERGYAIITDEKGRVLDGTYAMKKGDSINVRMRDGEAKATVEEVSGKE